MADLRGVHVYAEGVRRSAKANSHRGRDFGNFGPSTYALVEEVLKVTPVLRGPLKLGLQ
jgi:hypothetical protein